MLRQILFDGTQVIDVRAPIEFHAGKIPFSVNLPILNDKERAEVGTVYKQQGQEAAVALGHRLIWGPIKSERVSGWMAQIGRIPDPGRTVVTCYRGGMRSQIAQQWIHDQGIEIRRVEGGYKKVRQHLLACIEDFCLDQHLLVLSGKTGSGKTKFIKQIQFMPSLDLEKLANHRGSAFGAQTLPQPSQADFENSVALELLRIRLKGVASRLPTLVEDESILIGRLTQPARFFHLLRSSPILLLEESLEFRIQNTFEEYVLGRVSEPDLFLRFQSSLQRIQPKLGGLRYREIQSDMSRAEAAWVSHGELSPSKIWIEKLLVWYYDPIYQSSLKKRDPIILVRGERKKILDYLDSNLHRKDF